MPTAAIARRIGVARSTVRGWLARDAGVAQSVEAVPLKGTKWGFESLHQHQFSAYAYLLGTYLGDGYLARVRRSYALRIYLNRRQQDVVARVRQAIEIVLPGRRVNEVQHRVSPVTEVTCYSRDWPLVFPQHGPGRKHTRRIVLAEWQRSIVEARPADFLRGCRESDGCRHRRIVNGKDYPAYSFSNRSEDILQLFVWTCELLSVRCRRSNAWTLSIARRPDVALLDRLFASTTTAAPVSDPRVADPHTLHTMPSSLRNTSTPGA